MVNNEYTVTGSHFEMPEDVTEIADRAFAKNKELKHIDLRNVRYIGAFAFQECSALESVIMSNTAVIGQGAFEFCRSLRSVTFGAVADIGEDAFSFCGMLDIPEMPRTLTHIGKGAFSHTDIRRVDLHWMEEIPPHLFSSCASLGYADISGAKVVGDWAFEGCSSLSYVRFGDLRRTGSKAFQRCDSLELASLPETIQFIGDDAFSNIRAGLTVPRSIRHIGRDCFGPVDRRKSIRIYRSSLYEFRNYFRDDRACPGEEDEHFYMWESAVDVTVLDDETEKTVGFLPLFCDLYYPMRTALTGAFLPDNTFDYSVLDTVFIKEISWNQKAKDWLIVMRSKYPHDLSDTVRADYEDYLQKHAKRMARRAIWDRDIEVLSFLCENGLIMEDSITGLIDYSISAAASECTAILLRRQSELNCHNTPFIDEL